MTYSNLMYIKTTLFVVVLFFISCGEKELNNQFPFVVTSYYINETSEALTSDGCLDMDIMPNDTLVLIESGVIERDGSLSPDNFPTSVVASCHIQYVKGGGKFCDTLMDDILNYEHRNEVSSGVFEFIFRFTEDKKSKAIPCETQSDV